MLHLICYDIAKNSPRRKVVKVLESYGWRMQYSVFTCELTERQAEELKKELSMLTDGEEGVMLLMAPLCAACASRLWRRGSRCEEPKVGIVA